MNPYQKSNPLPGKHGALAVRTDVKQVNFVHFVHSSEELAMADIHATTQPA